MAVPSDSSHHSGRVRDASFAAGLVTIFILSLFATRQVAATQLALPSAGYYTVWGHSSRGDVQAVVSFTAYSSWMDVWENSAYVSMRNGTANCRRSRVFGDNWELLWNWSWSGDPYPLSAPTGWIFDSIWFSAVTDGYAMRGYYQFTSDYNSATGYCAYGGGIGWEKPGQQVAWEHWATSTQ